MLIIYAGSSGSGKSTSAKEYIDNILSKDSNAKIFIIGPFEEEYQIFRRDNVTFYKSIDDLTLEDIRISELIVIEEFTSFRDDKKIEKLRYILRGLRGTCVLITFDEICMEEELMEMATEIRYFDRYENHLEGSTKRKPKYVLCNYIESAYGKFNLDNLLLFCQKYQIEYHYLNRLIRTGFIYENIFYELCEVLNPSDKIKKYWKKHYCTRVK